MFFSHYVFSEKFFTFWISVSMYVKILRPRYELMGSYRIWALLSGTFSVLLPVWESRREIAQILVGCWKALVAKWR